MRFKVRVRESGLPKWIEFSEGIVCPLDLFKEEWVKVQCWRPSTGRTTTTRDFGCFTLCGIILRKLAIKI